VSPDRAAEIAQLMAGAQAIMADGSDDLASQQRRTLALNAPGDGRVYFRMGQAAWHHAQDQTSRHRSGRRRLLLNLIAYNLIRIPKLLAA
jgi:hypothetical protein